MSSQDLLLDERKTEGRVAREDDAVQSEDSTTSPLASSETESEPASDRADGDPGVADPSKDQSREELVNLIVANMEKTTDDFLSDELKRLLIDEGLNIIERGTLADRIRNLKFRLR